MLGKGEVGHGKEGARVSIISLHTIIHNILLASDIWFCVEENNRRDFLGNVRIGSKGRRGKLINTEIIARVAVGNDERAVRHGGHQWVFCGFPVRMTDGLDEEERKRQQTGTEQIAQRRKVRDG